MFGVHALHVEDAGRRLETRTAARHLPHKRLAARFLDRHALPAEVDENFHSRERGSGQAAKSRSDNESAKQNV
jgi:hypothetical protein